MIGKFSFLFLLFRNDDLLKMKDKFSQGDKQPAHCSCVPARNPSNVRALNSSLLLPSSLGDVVLLATIQSIIFPLQPPITTMLPGIGKNASYGDLWGEI